MADEESKLTPKDVESQYGVDRATLLGWERDGRIFPERTSGGHRRYNEGQIKTVLSTAVSDGETDIMSTVPSYHEYGVTGLRQQNGEILEERLKELRGYSGRVLKREMRLNDPVLGAIFFGISTSMRKPEFRIRSASDKPYDKNVAEFVDQAIHDMSFDFKTQMAVIIEELLEQGFALTETVYKKRLGQRPPEYISDPAKSMYNDGRIGWRKWAIRPATSLAVGREWILDDNGGVQGVNQLAGQYGTFGKYEVRPITIEKLLHFRTTPHPGNSPEGMEIHRPAYTSWWRKTNIEEIEGIGIERDLAGIPVVYLGKGTTKRGPNSDFELAKSLVVNLRNDDQTGVVLPHQKLDNDGNGILLELLSSSSRRSYDTNAIINRYNKLIAMTTLSQFLFLGMENVGSYALVRYEGDLFSMAISAYLDNICSIINRFAIQKLVDFNGFSHDNGYPELVPGRVGIPDLETFGAFVNNMVSSNVITIDDEFEQSVRQIAGLPPMSVNIQGGDRTKVVTKQPEQQSIFGAEEMDLQKK